MDPVSILQVAGFAASAAKGAVEISKDLYILFNEAKHIDQTIQGLAAEVQGLGSACTLVDDRLQSIVEEHDEALSSSDPAKTRLWSCVELQVRDSRKTIDQLRVALQGVRGQGSGVWNQVWRQIKLNTKTKDIGEARNRVRSHTASLQMVLQTIAIELSHKGDQQLQTILAKAEECLTELKALRSDSIEEDVDQRAREEAILALGERTVSVAQESLYGASIANGSVLGDPASKSLHVHGWLQDVTAIERTRPGLDTINETDLHSAISDEPSAIFTDDFRRTSTAPTSVAPNDHYKESLSPLSVHSDGEDESEGNELLIDAAKESLKTAEACFQATDYKEASEELQEALKIILELATHQQSQVCDTWEIRYLLSVCAYHTESLEDAKAQLRTVVDFALRESLNTNEQRKQCCEAGHLLSIVCVKLGHLEEARQYCQSAYDARSKVFGKSHPETYQSLALLARIWHLKGNSRRCNIYSRLIPESERQSYLTKIDDIIPSGSVTVDKPTREPPREPTMKGLFVGNAAAFEFGKHTSETTPPFIASVKSQDRGVSLGSGRMAEYDATKSRSSTQTPTARPPYQPLPTTSLSAPTVTTSNGIDARSHVEKNRSTPHVAITKETESENMWESIIDRLDLDTKENPGSTGIAARPLIDKRTEAPCVPISLNQTPQQIPQVNVVPWPGATDNRAVVRPGFNESDVTLQRTSSFDDRASLVSSRTDVDDKLLSTIENPAERREIEALLPQMHTIADTVMHNRKRAHVLEQRYRRALPRECILETSNAERSLALARKYAHSALRQSTRPEVQNAERRIRKATQSLEKYESCPEESNTSEPVPAATRKGTFARFKKSGNSDKTIQDVLIETSSGDIMVRILDDSKPCKQFTSLVQNGSYTDRALFPTMIGSTKSLKAVNGDHSFLVTPAPTRILDEKLALVGYVVQGFELIAQAVDAETTTPLNMLDCRLTSSTEAAARGQVEMVQAASSRKRRGMTWGISDGMSTGMNGL